jgi:hypothetical protein
VVISFFDGFHTHSGTTEYPHVVILKMAWWTPLLFGSVVGFGGLLYDRAYRWMNGPERLPSWDQLVTALFLFGLLYASSGFLPINNTPKLILLLAGALLVWLRVDGSRQGLVLAALNAALGCTTEIVLTHFGAFRHLQADIAGIPIWLPGLYLAAGPTLGQLARKTLASPSYERP